MAERKDSLFRAEESFFRFLERFSSVRKGEERPRLTELVRIVREFGIPADGVLVNTYLPGEGVIRFYARATDEREWPDTVDVKVTEESAALLRKGGRPQTLLVRDISEDPVTEAATRDLVPGIGSFVMQQLELGGRHVGIVAFWSRRPGAFTADNARFVSSLLLPLSTWASQICVRSLDIENERLKKALEGNERAAARALTANSPDLGEVAEKLLRAAPSGVTILIEGESGVGKEVVARAAVRMSPRRSGPFIAVNCGAIPENLLESELFGYERGAFTDARSRHIGYFEQADGGTLFLDEVGELPLLAQVKLLRAIQARSFTRVGGEKPIKVDVRIIAATNRDLASLVRDGRFREDLYYRLAVFPIRVPPLRERPRDLKSLALLFVRQFAKKYGVEGDPEVTADALQEAASYRWPGNVRELENAAERAVLQEGARVTRLVPDSPYVAVKEECPVPVSPAPRLSADSLSELTFEEMQRLYFRAVLGRTLGRISGPRGAARICGLNPNTLRSRLQKLGILKSAES